jgi:small subunit ribosomal protein S5
MVSDTQKKDFRTSREADIIQLKPKYVEKIIQVKRVTKVVKGGKKMTFRAVVVVGDVKESVGVGIGKADDANLAIEKAIINGKKNLIKVPLTRTLSIAHMIISSFGASKLFLHPAKPGTGIIAGGAVRAVLELAGIKNILAKQLGAANLLNNAQGAIQALQKLAQKMKVRAN